MNVTRYQVSCYLLARDYIYYRLDSHIDILCQDEFLELSRLASGNFGSVVKVQIYRVQSSLSEREEIDDYVIWTF